MGGNRCHQPSNLQKTVASLSLSISLKSSEIQSDIISTLVETPLFTKEGEKKNNFGENKEKG